MKKVLSILGLIILLQIAIPSASYAHGDPGGHKERIQIGIGRHYPAPPQLGHYRQVPPPHGHYRPVPHHHGLNLVFARRYRSNYNSYYPINYFVPYNTNFYYSPAYIPVPLYGGYININF